MTRTLLLVILAVSPTVGFAQGKISFANDSNHLVYFTPYTAKLNVADAGVAGQGVYTTPNAAETHRRFYRILPGQ